MTQKIALEQLAQSGAANGQLISWNDTLKRFELVNAPAAGVTNYGDLQGRPTLGSAASQDASAFLAANGVAADSGKLGNQLPAYYLNIANATGTLDPARRNDKGLGCTVSGKPAAGLVAVVQTSPWAFTLSAANSSARLRVDPATSYTIIIQKNGTQVGTIVFAAGATLGTVSFTNTTVAVNDIFTLHFPATADADASDLAVRLMQA